MATQFTEAQTRKYFASLNTELGLPSKDECAFLCPIHGDNNASASFNLYKQYWYCHACGVGGDLYSMEMLLCPDESFPAIKERVDAICNGEERENVLANLPEQKPLVQKAKPVLVHDVTYLYKFFDEESGLIKARYAISRYHHADDPSKKSFRIWHKTSQNSPIIWKKPENFPLIPYQLHEVQKASIVFVVEGEKCVDALRAVLRNGKNPDAIAVTCNPFGAGKWEDSYSHHLLGKTVVILPDNDAPGRNHAESVAKSIHRVSPATKVFVGHVPMEAEGSDIADYLSDGHSIEDVMAIVQNSKEWKPTAIIEAIPSDAVMEVNPKFPEDCLYGWCGEKAKELGTPLGFSFPAMLGVASVMCPNVGHTRSNLYVANLGPSGSGKSDAIKRAKETIAWAPGMLFESTPGSDRGVYKMLQHEEPTSKAVLLALDELINLMNKVNIQGSSLSSVLNTLWSNDVAGGSTKDFKGEVRIKLSILGGLICKDGVDFQSIFGKTSTEGLSRRFVFGVTEETNWDWEEYTIAPEPMMEWYTVEIPSWCWHMAKEWKQSKEGRHNLVEPAMRVALITSFANHDLAISDNAMKAALRFMEWQEAIRSIYKPGEAETMEAEIESIIMNALEKVGVEVKVNWHKLYKNKHLDRKGNLKVKYVRDGLAKEGRIGYDPETKAIWLKHHMGGKN